MITKIKTIFIIFFIFLGTSILNAQNDKVIKRGKNIDIELRGEFSKLKNLCDSMLFSKNESTRFSSNAEFIKNFTSYLQRPDISFYSPLDSLKTLSVVIPKDKKFKIITWAIALNNGSYRFYGVIHYNSKKFKIKPLIDGTSLMFRHKKLKKITLKNDTWYGAKYKDIISVETPKRTYYVLVGWKGIDFDSTQKILESLYINPKGEPRFGLSVFQDSSSVKEEKKLEKNKVKSLYATTKNFLGREKEQFNKRVIFEFSQKLHMMLKYDTKVGGIIFDNIVPIGEGMKGIFKFYGPNLTYGGYFLEDGKWKLEKYLDLKNEAREDDDKYYFPGQATQATEQY